MFLLFAFVALGLSFFGSLQEIGWKEHPTLCRVVHKTLTQHEFTGCVCSNVMFVQDHTYIPFLPHASKVLFLPLSVTFWFMNEIFWEHLNGFPYLVASNSHRCVWFVTRLSLTVRVKGQGHQGQKMRRAVPSPRLYPPQQRSLQIMSHQQMGPFHCCRG